MPTFDEIILFSSIILIFVVFFLFLGHIKNRQEEKRKVVEFLRERSLHLRSLGKKRLDPYIAWLDRMAELVGELNGTFSTGSELSDKGSEEGK